MDFWPEFLKFISSATIVGGLIVWLIKEFINKQFSNDLEKYKAQLELLSHKDKERFTKLHEIRAVAIRDLYTNLVNFLRSINSIINSLDPEKTIYTYEGGLFKQIQENVDLSIIFEDHFRKNRILFHENICKSIDNLLIHQLHAVKKVGLVFLDSSFADKEGFDTPRKEMFENLDNLNDVVKKKIPPILAELENEFRLLLGVESE